MIAVDTNILIRYVINDDLLQADQASKILRSGSVLLLRSVLLETEWVLRKTYQLDRVKIARIIRALLGLPGLVSDNNAATARALDWFEAGLDFADALHLASSGAASKFVTFDQPLRRRATRLGANPPVRHP